jgi:cellulose synthase/poly-beta-1,6-N-acetylglucosamine synthase-like glycosyltransferase
VTLNPRPTRSVSVLICTYNRAELLCETLQAVRRCVAPADCDVEIVVIDNNSSDHSADVVRQVAAQPGYPVRYAVEMRQGKSYALNAGLQVVRGDVVALTDDDVLPARDWLTRIVEAFRVESVVFVFGKVLPRWSTVPAPELLPRRARDIWGPLALIDYGDTATRYTTEEFRHLRMPIGANLAVRRDALEHVGGWRTDLGRVDNSLVCGEDRELCVRLFRAGLYEGIYDPGLTVQHYVPASRMTRRYFRRWYYWHGRTLARMAESFYIDLDLQKVPHIGPVPRFIYRETALQARRWLRALVNHDALESLIEELLLIQYAGFFAESFRPYRDRRKSREADRRPETVGRSRGDIAIQS